jgi:hypothetical protein
MALRWTVSRRWILAGKTRRDGFKSFLALGTPAGGVVLYLNRRQWPLTVLNSWTGNLSTAFNSWTELHLNRRQLRVRVFGLVATSE